MDAAADPMRWVRRVGIALALVLGKFFILWQNRFHYTPAVAFVWLAYVAVVMAVVNLWRTGANAVAPDQAGEEAWVRPLGARDELDKEKRTLLKAIREAEFDREMGKLSAADADAMIKTYRARAIEVMKALDGYAKESASVREQIEKEVQARVELERGTGAKKKAKKGKAKEAAP
jgi:hypothetical protein